MCDSAADQADKICMVESGIVQVARREEEGYGTDGTNRTYRGNPTSNVERISNLDGTDHGARMS